MRHLAQEQSPISHLPSNMLSEIFIRTLPSHAPVHYTPFPSPEFRVPAAAASPLLLCQISSRWRTIAIADPRLWASLDPELIQHSELVRIWLSRAARLPLSLRMARPLSPFADLRTIRPAPTLLEEHNYTGSPRHLSRLLSQISQCRHIAMVDLIIPILINPLPSLALQSLSVVVRRSNAVAPEWFSRLMGRAPQLRSLHWAGPAFAAPWEQLTHLSLDLQLFLPAHLKQILEAIVCVQHLRLYLEVDRQDHFRSPQSPHILPIVSTFNFSGETALLRFLSLPNMTHLVIEWVTRIADREDLRMFLQRSECAITVLELWESVRWGSYFSRVSPALLLSPQIAGSLTRLIISSRDLNEFFVWLERRTPGTLPWDLVLLRDVDRCFRIDDLPGIAEACTSGVLPALIKTHLPLLAQLHLDDNQDPQECHAAGLMPSSQFALWRSTALCREYESWWHSVDGTAFQAARATNELAAVLEFDIEWVQLLDDPDNHSHPNQNRFARTTRTGYQFV